MTDRQKNILMNGSGDKEIDFSFHSRNGGTRHRRMKFEGVVANIDRRYHESPSEYTREVMSKYMTELPCETCHGKRLSKKRYLFTLVDIILEKLSNILSRMH